MRKLLVVIFAVLPLFCVKAAESDKARTEWMAGFVKMEAADRVAEKNPAAAIEQYRTALEVFDTVRRKYPQWNPTLLNYRVNYCQQKIQELTRKLDSQSNTMSREELVQLSNQKSRELQVLESANRELKSRVELLTEALQRARAESAKASNTEGAMASLASANANLKKQNEELALKLQAAEQRATAGANSEHYRQEAENMRVRVTQLEHELSNAKNNASIQETRRIAAERDLQTLLEKKDGMESALKTANALAESRKADNETLLNAQKSLKAKVAELEAFCAQIKTDLESQKKLLAQKQLENDELRYLRLADEKNLAEIKEDAEKNSAFATEAINLRKENIVLHDHLKQAQTQLAAATAELQKVKNDASKDRTKLILNEEQNNELTAAVARINTKLLQTEQQNVKLNAQITELTMLLENSRGKESSYENVISEKQKEIARLADVEKRLLEQMNLVRAQERQIAELRSGHENAAAEASKEAANIAHSKSQAIARLEQEKQALNLQLSDAQKKIAELKAAIKQDEQQFSIADKKSVETPTPVAESSAKNANDAERLSKVNALLQQGADAERQGKLEAAQFNYQKALELDNDNKTALQRLGLIAASLGNDAEAVKQLKMAFKHDPDDIETLVALGFATARLGQPDWAVSYLGRAAALEPDNAEAARFYGAALSTMGWTQAAEKQLVRAYNLDQKDPEAPFNLAVLYVTANPPDIANARKWYAIAIENGAERDPGMDKILIKK